MADPRPGAKAILDAIARRRFENRSEGQRLRKLLRYESALWADGVLHVAGIDEAGMSPLAGPVAAAAVVFAPGSRIPGVDDSKKLDAPTRERLAAEIKETAVAWSVGFAEVEEIDTINIYWAGLLAMRRAVEGLALRPEHLLIDARRLRDLANSAARHREGRHKEPDDCRGVHSGEDRPRRLDVQAGCGVSRLRILKAQRLSRPRTSGRDQKARCVTNTPALVRAGTRRCWACRRFHRGRTQTHRKPSKSRTTRSEDRPDPVLNSSESFRRYFSSSTTALRE